MTPRFRWVVCQLDALTKCRHIKGLREALKALPETLDGTYDRILMSIEKNDRPNALKVLQWLAYSARPMRIEEVADAIAVNLDDPPRFDFELRLLDPRALLDICSSLVNVSLSTYYGWNGVPNETGELRLAHYSVKEYLVSERIQTGPAAAYKIQEIHANKTIAESCLAYLLHFEKLNSLTSQNIEDYPLARYAAEYWTKHANVAGKEAGSINLLCMLLLSREDAYVNWVRLYDPDKPWVGRPDLSKSLEKIPPPLYSVSLTGLIEPVKMLLEEGADVNAQAGHFGTALQAAAFGGHDQVVQRLLEEGADVNAQAGHFGTALQAAADGGHDQVVQRLELALQLKQECQPPRPTTMISERLI
jgi:hypothetical protein